MNWQLAVVYILKICISRHHGPKGLDPMVSEEFFTIGEGSILLKAFPRSMGSP
jgi:hypothetical protein